MRAIIAQWALALLLAAQSFSSDTPRKNKAGASEWERLVTEAQAVSRNFSPEERADLLLDIVQIPASNAADKTKQWSLELFSIGTTQLKLGHYRAVIQKNALTALSTVDPERAAELYTTQDLPDMWNEPTLLEDYRAFGTGTLFPNLWAKSGVASLPTIKRIADWIGSTGEYPFAAMTTIVEDVAEKNKPTAEALVADAVGSFKVGKRFLDRDQEFTDFLLGAQKFMSPSLLREGIEAQLSALDAEARDEQKTKYMLQASDSQHKVQFSSQADYIVYRLLPLIRKMDPTWADQVKQKHGVLQNLPSAPETEPVRLTGVGVPPDQTASPAEVAAGVDDHRLFQLTMLTEADPKQAADIAMNIQDPARRAIGFATLAPSYSKVDQQQAADWLKESKAELDRLPAGKLKLKLIIALANASLMSGDQARATTLFEKGFDLGEEMFEEDLKLNPGKMAYYTDGEEQLAGLIESFAKRSEVHTLTIHRVESTRDDLLKAKLLVAAAKGTASQDPAAR